MASTRPFVAQGQASLRIDLDAPGPEIPRSMYGIFFEEINHAGEGGLYGELIQNRGVEEPPTLFALAGYDEEAGEVVLKVTSVSDQAHRTSVQLHGAGSVGTTGRLYTLARGGADVQNTLDDADRLTTQEATFDGTGTSFELDIALWSFTLLRFPAER